MSSPSHHLKPLSICEQKHLSPGRRGAHPSGYIYASKTSALERLQPSRKREGKRCNFPKKGLAHLQNIGDRIHHNNSQRTKKGQNFSLQHCSSANCMPHFPRHLSLSRNRFVSRRDSLRLLRSSPDPHGLHPGDVDDLPGRVLLDQLLDVLRPPFRHGTDRSGTIPHGVHALDRNHWQTVAHRPRNPGEREFRT